jgi:hypothetical protein
LEGHAAQAIPGGDFPATVLAAMRRDHISRLRGSADSTLAILATLTFSVAAVLTAALVADRDDVGSNHYFTFPFRLLAISVSSVLDCEQDANNTHAVFFPLMTGL